MTEKVFSSFLTYLLSHPMVIKPTCGVEVTLHAPSVDLQVFFFGCFNQKNLAVPC